MYDITVLIIESADKKLDTKIHRIQAILPVKITIVHYRLSGFRNETPCLTKWNADRNTILHRAFETKFLLDSLFSKPEKIIVQKTAKFIYGNIFPIASIKNCIFDYTEKSLTRCIVRRTPFLRHRSNQMIFLHSFNPAWPTVMGAAIRMNDWMFIFF